MINEDEDQVELVSNVLEDKVGGRNYLGQWKSNSEAFQVIPRYNIRGRNRSSSAKYTNNTSLLPSAGVAVRSNSFRVNRNTSSSLSGGGNTAGTVTPDFCKHIKYCCLHQNFNSARLDNAAIDRSRNQEYSDGRAGSQFKFTDLNTNNYSNFSDDEKSMKFNKKFSADHPNPGNVHNKSLPPNYDSFENRKCNCGKLLRKCLHTAYGCRTSRWMKNEWKSFPHSTIKIAERAAISVPSHRHSLVFISPFLRINHLKSESLAKKKTRKRIFRELTTWSNYFRCLSVINRRKAFDSFKDFQLEF